jgi:hypothetical protein
MTTIRNNPDGSISYRHGGVDFTAADLYSPDCDIPLLRKHLEWVLNQSELPYHKRDWRQGVWAAWKRRQDKTMCNTYRCFAGNVAYAAGAKFVEYDLGGQIVEVDVNGTLVTIPQFARRELGITRVASNCLFDAHNTANSIREICEAIAGERL